MNKSTTPSSALIFLAGVSNLFIGILNIALLLIAFHLLRSVQAPSENLVLFIQYLFNAYPQSQIQLIIPIFTLISGIVFIIASRKIRKGERVLEWSICSLSLALIIFFELNSGAFGLTTASVLAIIGGLFGLIEITKKTERNSK